MVIFFSSVLTHLPLYRMQVPSDAWGGNGAGLLPWDDESMEVDKRAMIMHRSNNYAGGRGPFSKLTLKDLSEALRKFLYSEEHPPVPVAIHTYEDIVSLA